VANDAKTEQKLSLQDRSLQFKEAFNVPIPQVR
jgi:hypothetical protein